MKSELQDVFCEVFEDENFKITPDLSREGFDTWDSLKNLELMITVENKFNVKFSLEELERISTVKDILDILYEKRNVKK